MPIHVLMLVLFINFNLPYTYFLSSDGKMVKVGEYHALTDFLNLSSGQPIIWRGRQLLIEMLVVYSSFIYIYICVGGGVVGVGDMCLGVGEV